MKIKKFIHEGVGPDGSLPDEGSVVTEGGLVIAPRNSAEAWVTLLMPRTDDGVVEGICITFDSTEEMNKTLQRS